MIGLARAILPFDDADPAEAIRASLARFRRGGSGAVPDAWLVLENEAEYPHAAHDARLTFIKAASPLRVRGAGKQTLA